jgi:hypothetical protein
MADEVRPLGPMLERFAAFHHMEEGGLAAFLGVRVDTLAALRAEVVPEERAEEFLPAVERIAGASGASVARLMQVTRIAKMLR